MALTEIYVDPSIAADSGTGTIGDPFGDLEYAIEQTTFDTTNGTRVNIKAGTDEVLAAELDAALADTVTTVAWTPSRTAPLVFQGYTTAAGDGGVGGIDANTGHILSTTRAYIQLRDLHLHNVNATYAVQFAGAYCGIINCEINNVTGIAVSFAAGGLVKRCYIHDVSSTGINCNSGIVSECFLKNGTKSFSNAILSSSVYSQIRNNIISISGATNGITGNLLLSVRGNSIFSVNGTGTGILGGGSANIGDLTNNVVEGFSGAGGAGIDLSAANVTVYSYGGNSVYNCTTDFTAVGNQIYYDWGGSETLTASPFTDPLNNDFSPVDTGSVKEGAVPQTLAGP